MKNNELWFFLIFSIIIINSNNVFAKRIDFIKGSLNSKSYPVKLNKDKIVVKKTNCAGYDIDEFKLFYNETKSRVLHIHYTFNVGKFHCKNKTYTLTKKEKSKAIASEINFSVDIYNLTKKIGNYKRTRYWARNGKKSLDDAIWSIGSFLKKSGVSKSTIKAMKENDYKGLNLKHLKLIKIVFPNPYKIPKTPK
jgi:hypothetical protein